MADKSLNQCTESELEKKLNDYYHYVKKGKKLRYNTPEEVEKEYNRLVELHVEHPKAGIGIDPSSAEIHTYRLGSQEEANRNLLIKKLIEENYTPAAITAIVSRVQIESDFNEKAENGNGGAFGLAQWTRKSQRQGLFKSYERTDIQKSTAEQQIDFLIYELSTYEYRFLNAYLKKTTDPKKAAEFIVRDYEKPGGVQVEEYKTALLAGKYDAIHVEDGIDKKGHHLFHYDYNKLIVKKGNALQNKTSKEASKEVFKKKENINKNPISNEEESDHRHNQHAKSDVLQPISYDGGSSSVHIGDAVYYGGEPSYDGASDMIQPISQAGEQVPVINLAPQNQEVPISEVSTGIRRSYKLIHLEDDKMISEEEHSMIIPSLAELCTNFIKKASKASTTSKVRKSFRPLSRQSLRNDPYSKEENNDINSEKEIMKILNMTEEKKRYLDNMLIFAYETADGKVIGANPEPTQIVNHHHHTTIMQQKTEGNQWWSRNNSARKLARVPISVTSC